MGILLEVGIKSRSTTGVIGGTGSGAIADVVATIAPNFSEEGNSELGGGSNKLSWSVIERAEEIDWKFIITLITLITLLSRDRNKCLRSILT